LSEPTTLKATLYLIPVALGGDDAVPLLPPLTLEIARRLDTFIAEEPKSARRFLKAIGHPRPLQELRILTLNEHSDAGAVASALAPLLAGTDCGLVSEAGCPAVADPGAALVGRAHETGVRIVPLVGPSSIMLALMASGMDGQRFAFHGYLPADREGRERALKELDARSQRETQIFIETPYRAPAMLKSALDSCRGDTSLCIAADLTLPGEFIATRSVSDWKKKPPVLDRRLVVFLLWRNRAGSRRPSAG
jgi:16S rRNA (cytidine1402-2'-O)-methyltransferase